MFIISPVYLCTSLLMFVTSFNSIVSSVPAKAHISARVPYVIGGVVSGVVILLCFGLILMFCCCRKKKIVKKDYEMGRGTQDAPPPYYTNGNGMENKAMERSMDVIEDTLKTFDQQNGYISYNGLHLQPTNGNGSKSSTLIIHHHQ